MKTGYSSIQFAFLVYMVGIAAFSIILWGSVSIIADYVDFRKNSSELRDEYLISQKEMLKSSVSEVIKYIDYMKNEAESYLEEELELRGNMAYDIAFNIYLENKNTHFPNEIEKMIKDALRPIRFNDGKGYFFAVTMKGIEKLYPTNPEYEETNVIDLKDLNGNLVIQDEIEMVKSSGEGFVTHYWRKPEEKGDLLYPKKSFVKYFQPLDWYLGTGEYLDDAEKLLQKETIDRIAGFRYGMEGYFFGSTFSGNSLFSNGRVSKENNSIWDLTDSSGRKVIQMQIAAAKKPEGGFVSYSWPKLSDENPFPKLSFVYAVPDWEWVIGTGVYMDGIEQLIAENKAVLVNNIRKKMVNSFFIFLILLFCILLIASYLSSQIGKSIKEFSSSLEKASRDRIRIKSDKFHFMEFRKISDLVNRMLKERERTESSLRDSELKVENLKKMESLGMLAGGVAHDLNNVLSGIVSYPDLLLSDLPKDSPLEKPLITIKKSGIKATKIVQDLLTIARGVASDKRVLNLNEIIKQYMHSPELSRLRDLYGQLTISTDLEVELLNISCSEVHMSKVIMNLVSNAVEAAGDSGEVKIKTINRYLEKSFKGYEVISTGEYVILSVSDNGPGIRPEDIEKIFEPFYTKKTMGRSGTGLGLAIIWNVIQDHKAYIDVISDNKGTTFEVYFPVSRDDILSDQKLPSLVELKGQGETVLVIDDLESQQEISSGILEKLNYTAVCVGSGKEAVEYLKHEKADILLLDMIMHPGISGYETYKRIIKDNPHQKAIIMSGYVQTEDVEKTKALGAGQFLLKPVTLETLAMAIKTELSGTGTIRGPAE